MDNVIKFPAPGWENRLSRDNQGNPRGSLSNLELIFNHAEALRGHVRFNDVTKEVEVTGGEFAGVPEAVLHLNVTAWLEREYGMVVKSHLVTDAILMVAYAHRYDPLRDYLRGLSWDGTARIDDFLVRYMGAVTVDAAGDDITEHVRRISRRWMISAVARALNPGCQSDSMLILEGPQGIKKTSAVRVLGGDWFSTTEANPHDKDTRLLIARSWIVEFGELTSILRWAHKGFLTETKDEFRPPYGRRPERFPRRLVPVGTTNLERYLADPTGHRRFWVVKLKSQAVDTAPLSADKDQLFAEAVVAFDAGEKWWLEPHEAAAAERQAQERVAPPAYVDQIWRWWCSLPLDEKKSAPKLSAASHVAPLGRRSAFTLTDFLTRALQVPVTQQSDKRVLDETGAALKTLGFTRKQVRVDGRQQWAYVATPQMLEAGDSPR